MLLQGQAVGGLCLGPGSAASSPQIDAAEPAGEQSCPRGAAGGGPAAASAAAARTPQDAHADQRHLGAADHQEYHGKKHVLSVRDRIPRQGTRRSWEARDPARGPFLQCSPGW